MITKTFSLSKKKSEVIHEFFRKLYKYREVEILIKFYLYKSFKLLIF